MIEIVELSAGEVEAAASELAQLLLDAHAANMALGLSGPLTAEHAREAWIKTAAHEGTGSDRFYEAVGWSRLGALPAYSARPDGTLAGSAF